MIADVTYRGISPPGSPGGQHRQSRLQALLRLAVPSGGPSSAISSATRRCPWDDWGLPPLPSADVHGLDDMETLRSFAESLQAEEPEAHGDHQDEAGLGQCVQAALALLYPTPTRPVVPVQLSKKASKALKEGIMTASVIEDVLALLPLPDEEEATLRRPSKLGGKVHGGTHISRAAELEPVGALAALLMQELQQLEHLLHFARKGLEALRRHLELEGDTTEQRDRELLELEAALLQSKVPEHWSRIAWTSEKPLKAWAKDFQERLSWLRACVAHKPLSSSLWISRVSRPQSVFVALARDYVKNHGGGHGGLELVRFDFKVITGVYSADAANGLCVPPGCIFLFGLYLHGAQWNERESCLEETEPGRGAERMPAVLVRPRSSAERPPAMQGGRSSFTFNGDAVSATGSRRSQAGSDAAWGDVTSLAVQGRPSTSWSRQVTPNFTRQTSADTGGMPTVAPRGPSSKGSKNLTRSVQGFSPSPSVPLNVPLFQTFRGAEQGSEKQFVCHISLPALGDLDQLVLAGVCLTCE